MIPRTIHFIALSKDGDLSRPDPEPFATALAKARSLHPDWTVKVWRTLPSEGTYPLSGYYEKARSFAQKADLLRIDVVADEGGIYLDWDEVLERPLDVIAERADTVFCSEDGHSLTNTVFGATRDHSLIRRLQDHLLANEPDWSVPPNVTTGPSLFTSMFAGEDIALVPRATFYPYGMHEELYVHPFSFGSHRWDGSWITPSLKKRVKNMLAPYGPKNAVRVGRRVWRKTRRSAFGNGVLAALGQRKQLVAALWPSTGNVGAGAGALRDWRGRYADRTLLESVVRGGDFVAYAGETVDEALFDICRIVGQFGRVFVFCGEDAAKAVRATVAGHELAARLVTVTGPAANVGGTSCSREQAIETLRTFPLSLAWVCTSATSAATAEIQGLVDLRCPDVVVVKQPNEAMVLPPDYTTDPEASAAATVARTGMTNQAGRTKTYRRRDPSHSPSGRTFDPASARG